MPCTIQPTLDETTTRAVTVSSPPSKKRERSHCDDQIPEMPGKKAKRTAGAIVVASSNPWTKSISKRSGDANPNSNPSTIIQSTTTKRNTLDSRALKTTKPSALKPGTSTFDQPKSGPSGISTSASERRRILKAIADGDFKLDYPRWARFTKKVLDVDPNAELDEARPCEVRHSACGMWVKLTNAYHMDGFIRHLESPGCRKAAKKHAGSSTSTLTKLAKDGGWVRKSGRTALSTHETKVTEVKHVQRPCPGLTEAWNDRVIPYLQRSTSDGGGAPALSDIAVAEYHKPFGRLNTSQKEGVYRAERNQYRWINVRAARAVFSSTCA